MSDNVLQTLQTLVQDVVAPDVRELKMRVDSLEKQMNSHFASVKKQMEANTKALLSAIGELKAQSELSTMTAVAELRERVAVLESTRN